MNLKDIGEFGFIERIARRIHTSDESIIKGIDDDCAVFDIGGADVTLVTTDLLVEDIHFLRGKISPTHLGRKSLSVNLSDIAAMGGTPRFFFLSMAIPPSVSLDYLDAFIDGLMDVAETHRVVLTGGDTTSSPERLVINITVIGNVLRKHCKYRSGAQPNDIIQVSGPLGSSAAGLAVLLNEKDIDLYHDFVSAHNNPTSRSAVGIALGSISGVTAMIDISDGLLSDMGHICLLSGTGAAIRLESIPVASGLRSLADKLNLRWYDWVLSGGEDYELCWTVRPEQAEKALEAAARAGAPDPRSIGVISRQSGITVTWNGAVIQPGTAGWDHFKQG